MVFEIVRYVPSHREAVVDLWKKCGLVVPWNDPVEDIQRKLDFQPDLFLVALLDGRLISSVMIGYEGHRGWMNYLAVLPEHQGQGYGRKLVERSIEELKKLGCLKLNVQVRESNKKVIEFYERLGFRDDHVISLGLRLN